MNTVYFNNSLVCVTVLIDTWWNVNVGEITGLTVFEGVLIDTWWNVNT